MFTLVLLDNFVPGDLRLLLDYVNKSTKQQLPRLNFLWVAKKMLSDGTRSVALPSSPHLPGLHFEAAIECVYSVNGVSVKFHLHVCDKAGKCEPRSYPGVTLNLPSGVRLVACLQLHVLKPAVSVGDKVKPAEMTLIRSKEDLQLVSIDTVLLDCSRPVEDYFVTHWRIRAITADGAEVSLLQRVDRCTQTEPPVLWHPGNTPGQRIRDSLDDADVVFLVGGERIPAHSLVLSAQSEVFRTMLRSGMVEAREKEVKVEDVSSAALQLFLDLLYTGAVEQEVLEPHLWPVMMLADKYLVDWVKEVCAAAAFNVITTENALETLQQLFKYRVPHTAADNILKYVVHNKRQTLAKVDWQQLDPELTAQLCQKLAQL